MKQFFIFIFIFFISCSQVEEKKQLNKNLNHINNSAKSIENNETKNNEISKKYNKVPDLKIKKTTNGKDFDIEQSIKESMEKVILAIKKGKLLTIRHQKKMCLILTSDEKTKIQIFELLSAPDEDNIKLGQNFYSDNISDLVKFKDKKRFFWYDEKGNIDFKEKDFELNLFDHPPQADVIILARNKSIKRVGFIDIIKKRTLVNHLELVFDSNKRLDYE